MARPRYRRRKEARPDEIADAAFDAFAEHGYSRARVEDVARRAGVSKGLMYLYFRTKEELFKAVIRRVVVPRVDAFSRAIETSDQTAEQLLRGPVSSFMRNLPDSRVAVVVRLMIGEGSRHPDLVDYYWENVASRGLALLQRIVADGVERGEFHRDALQVPPQLLIAPALTAIVWRLVFGSRMLDTDALIDTHIDMLLRQLRSGFGD